MLSLLSANVFADQKMFFSREGLTGVEAEAFMKDSIVLRIDSNEGYIDNLRVEIDYTNKKSRPYEYEEKAYVPLEFVLRGLDTDCNISGDSAQFTYNGKNNELSLTKNSDILKLNNEEFFVEGSAIAEILGIDYLFEDELVIFNPKKDSLPESIPAEIKKTLVSYTNYEWHNLYLGCEGYVVGMVIHPKNPNIMYTRSDVGGVYRLEADGKTWTPCSYLFGTENTSLSSMTTAIALDPNNENIVYAAQGMDRSDYKSDGVPYDIMKSEDYGETWTRTGFYHVLAYQESREGGEGMMVDPNNSNIMYIGTRDDGLWKTEDACETYTYVDGVPHGTPYAENEHTGGIRIVLFDDQSPVIDGRTSVIYVSVDGEGIYCSRDAGKTFTHMAGSPKCAMRMQVVNGELYVAAGKFHMKTNTPLYNSVQSGIFHYDGKKWNDITPTLSSQRGYASIAVNPKNPDMIFAFGDNFGTDRGPRVRSLDGGKTWESLNNQFESWETTSSIQFDPRDNYESLIETWGFGINRYWNLDGKKTEIQREDMSKGIEELCTQHIISVPSSDGVRLIICEMDRGRSELWNLEEKGQILRNPKMGDATGSDYCAASPNFIMSAATVSRGSSGGNLLLTEDGGESWYASTGWNTKILPMDAALSATLQENGYPVIMTITANVADGKQKGIYRSLDYGKTWELSMATTAVNSFWDQGHTYIASDRVNGKMFYFADSNGDFYTTYDAGETWELSSTFPGAGYDKTVKALPGSEKTVFYRDAGVGLYMSKDGGKRWHQFDFTKCTNYGFGKNKDGIEYASMYVFGVLNGVEGLYRSDDFGNTWERTTDPGNALDRANDITGDALTYGRVYVCKSGSGVVYGQIVGTDDTLPQIVMTTQSTVDTQGVHYAVTEKEYTISGLASNTEELRINGNTVKLDGQGMFNHTVVLNEGKNEFVIEASSKKGKMATPKYLTLNYDPKYVGIQLDDVVEGETIISNKDTYKVTGEVAEACTVYVGDAEYAIEEGVFSIDVPVTAVNGNITEYVVYAKDSDGNKSRELKVSIAYDDILPILNLEALPSTTQNEYVIVKGTLSEPGEIRINKTLIKPDSNNSFWHLFKFENEKNSLIIEARDSALNLMMPQIVNIVKQPYDIKQNNNMEIPYMDDAYKSSYVFDGVVNESDLIYGMNRYFEDPSCDAKFGLRWDEEKLYVFIRVVDDVKCNTAGAVYNNDAVEVYLDGNNSKKSTKDSDDKQLMYQWGKENGTTAYKFVDLDDGYSMEIEIPWSIIKTEVSAEKQIGFDIDVTDNDGTKEPSGRNGVIVFNGTADDWKDTSAYATLVLKK